MDFTLKGENCKCELEMLNLRGSKSPACLVRTKEESMRVGDVVIGS